MKTFSVLLFLLACIVGAAAAGSFPKEPASGVYLGGAALVLLGCAYLVGRSKP